MSEQHLEQSEEKKYPVKHSALCAGGTAAAMGILDVAAHLGPTGLVVGGLAAYVAWKHGPELLDQVLGFLPEQPEQEEDEQPEPQGAPKGRSFLDHALGWHPKPKQEAQLGQGNDLFSEDEAKQPLPFERLTMDEIVAHIPRNSYRVYLGRSVLGQGNKARAVDILMQHLKIIGASQFGKSSMAACILEQIIRTHDLDHALIAILDLENRTGRLFENDPHIVTFRMDGQDAMSQDLKMHARTKEQVLEYLGYILQMMDWRYQHTELEIEQMPLLIVYIEEFLALKDHFKRLISAAKDQAAKERALRDYDDLIYRMSELARRGLKARIQLLLCAQVDYRDDDLYEALSNITAGISFCVKPTAAQAAGFRNPELLKRNYNDMIKGQGVAEIAGTQDLILAPAYPLRQKLIDLERPNDGRARDVFRDAWTPRLEPSYPQNQGVRDPQNQGSPRSEREEESDPVGNVRNFPILPGIQPGEPSDVGPKEYRLSEDEIKEFIGAYKACGSIDKALNKMSKGGWYKKHASEIVRALGLRKEA